MVAVVYCDLLFSYYLLGLIKLSESLKKNHQFRYVYNKGKSIASKYLVMYMIKNNKDFNRLGISISKKVGNSVVRNRVRRKIKENYRLLDQSLNQGYDIIFIARVSIVSADYWQIKKHMIHLFEKHKIIFEECL